MFKKLINLIFGQSPTQKEYTYTKDKSFVNTRSLDGKNFNELLMVTEDWNGFLREKAVKKLGKIGNPLAIPKLIVRVNDWVPQVRESAVVSIEGLLIPKNKQSFVDNLPELYHLEKCERADHREFIKKVILFLIDPENNESIKSAINAENPYVARIAVTLCLDHSLLSEKEIVSKCLQHKDVIVRRQASNLLNKFSGSELKSYLEIAIKDPFMPVRREAFQIYLREFPEMGLKLAKKHVFDKHTSVREIAINYLLKNKFNISNLLKKTLLAPEQTAPYIRCAIYGLAYINVNDLEILVSGYSGHSYPSIRKSTLQALSTLNSDSSISYLITGLKDESPSVAKESARLINSQKLNISITQLLETIKAVSFEHTLQVCLSASRRLSKWKKLIFILSLAKILYGSNEENNKLLDEEFAKWDDAFNRSSTPPLDREKKEIKELYANTKSLFKPKRTLLEFTLSSCGITKS